MKKVCGKPVSSTQSNGVELEYRGLWQALDEQVHTAKLRQAEAEVSLQHILQERDLLRFENDELKLKFKETLASLTETSSCHLETQQILVQIKAEKDRILQKLSVFEGHQEWLESQGRKQAENILHWKRKCDEKDKENQQLLEVIQQMKEEYCHLETISISKDEKIADLEKSLLNLQQEHAIVLRSRTAKERLYNYAVKENERLRVEIEDLKKVLHLPINRMQPQLGTRNVKREPSRHVNSNATPVPTYTSSPRALDLFTGDENIESVPATPCLFGEIMKREVTTPIIIQTVQPKVVEVIDSEEDRNPWSSPIVPRTLAVSPTNGLFSSPPSEERRRGSTRMMIRRKQEQHQEKVIIAARPSMDRPTVSSAAKTCSNATF